MKAPIPCRTLDEAEWLAAREAKDQNWTQVIWWEMHGDTFWVTRSGAKPRSGWRHHNSIGKDHDPTKARRQRREREARRRDQRERRLLGGKTEGTMGGAQGERRSLVRTPGKESSS